MTVETICENDEKHGRELIHLYAEEKRNECKKNKTDQKSPSWSSEVTILRYQPAFVKVWQ